MDNPSEHKRELDYENFSIKIDNDSVGLKTEIKQEISKEEIIIIEDDIKDEASEVKTEKEFSSSEWRRGREFGRFSVRSSSFCTLPPTPLAEPDISRSISFPSAEMQRPSWSPGRLGASDLPPPKMPPKMEASSTPVRGRSTKKVASVYRRESFIYESRPIRASPLRTREQPKKNLRKTKAKGLSTSGPNKRKATPFASPPPQKKVRVAISLSDDSEEKLEQESEADNKENFTNETANLGKEESAETIILADTTESNDIDNGLVYDHVELNQINAANFYELDLHPSSESLYELAKSPKRGI